MQNDATGSEHQFAAARDLDWPNCYNVRDLGGLPTLNKQTTQWRAVVRGDILNRLTPAGEQALREYGIRTVIDIERGAQSLPADRERIHQILYNLLANAVSVSPDG